MDPSNSLSSNVSSNSRSGAFAYQTRLLERTSSLTRGASLSRSNSQSSLSVVSNSTGSSTTPTVARRWTPSHRVGTSLDLIRGKWEERSRESAEPEAVTFPPNPTKETFNTNTPSSTVPASASTATISPSAGNNINAVRGKWEERSREAVIEAASSPSPTKDTFKSSVPSSTSMHPLSTTISTSSGYTSTLSSRSRLDSDIQRTPTYLKRRTLPAPIIASPLSPNTTGVSVEVDSPTSSTTSRIRLPSTSRTISSITEASQSLTSRPSEVNLPSGSSSKLKSPSLNISTSASTIPSDRPSARDIANLSRRGTLNDSNPLPSSPLRRRPTSAQGFYSRLSTSSDNLPSTSPLKSSFIPRGAHIDPPSTPTPASPTTPSSSVMSPAPYRSSYMANKAKKSETYSGVLGVAGSRSKLGRHLPRIASGDGDDSLPSKVEPVPPPRDDVSARREKRLARLKEMNTNEALLNSPFSFDKSMPSQVMADSDAVAGLPGRISLKAPKGDQQPVPSARLLGSNWGSNWADKQRHLVQAYEYLCHVGEAQQWIEGCLGEELGFGVVEMEEGLRNGVVLAKLVRAFEGERVVRKIFVGSERDYRHSDNINIFFNFVRKEGLPEGFIFELTDLYDKKNLPKVIYCIHSLSHLLAHRGRAERIGNLLGRLEFSDDQLQKTQKGLKESGIAMPNFGNVGQELAKEINEQPEIEVETEDERRDRLLLENEGSIVQLQARCRAALSRRGHKALQARIKLAERHVAKFQTHSLGALLRRRLSAHRRVQLQLSPWIIALQAVARAVIVKRRWNLYLQKIRSISPQVVKMQAQIRGILQRRRFAKLKAALHKINFSFTKLQAVARAHVTRHARAELTKTFYKPQINFSVVRLQAQARAVLVRRRLALLIRALKRKEQSFVPLQAHCRGILVRRRMRAQKTKIRNVTDIVVGIQAAVRTYLARKRLLTLIRGLRKATPFIVACQTRARANLMRQEHKSVNKALAHVHTTKSVQTLQAFARASLVRRKHQQLNKALDTATPDVVQVQAAARGLLVRQEYRAWRDHLHRSHPVATILQAMLRGALYRRSFRAKLAYYTANLNKVVKIQSLFRAKETREQYRQLTLGKNVTVGTIKNFVHLLDDSDADFQEEIKIERLRKKVVEDIRENQALENDVNELDVKIALVVQNAKNFEDIIKARKKYGGENAAAHAARVSLLAAHGDPFSGPNTPDQEARRKLELYQQLFYLLQSRGEYLSLLFLRLSTEKVPDATRRFIERVVLTLFGYGQDHREDFLLLKLFQLAIRDQISVASSIEDVMRGHPMYINIAVHYLRPKQATYARDAFQAIIKEVINAEDLDLEVDPSIIHRNRLDLQEMRSGIASNQPKDVPFREAIDDPETRAIYIRHLQILRWWTEQFVTAITESTKKMPYGIRYLAREVLLWLRHKFPNAPEQMYAACIGRIVYYRYINPAIITPETFDIVSKTVNVPCRKNLAQISKVLTQIASGDPFGDESPAYLAINDYVRKGTAQMSTWFLEVADVPDAETQYHAHEFLDVTVQPKPIYISPNEIYSLHSLLLQHQDTLATQDDILRVILSELGGVPHLDNEELKAARDTAITLELTNRFAHVRDAHAEEKTLWVQAKRGVLAILRVQPAQDLLESLMRPVTENDEMLWEDILEAEMENELKQMPRRQPSTAVNDSAYRLEDIRSLKFAAVKALAIQNLLELEKQGKISRDDGFQGILNAIAGDVRSKHRKRIQRQQEMSSMQEALRQLAERKKYFMEQIDSYHSYVESAMSTMQRGKGKKRFVLPFTKQYFHLRDLQRSGQSPQFGSFIYSAKHLYEKGILLSIDQYSPRQFDKIQITLSSNSAGIFTVLMESTLLGVASKIASEDIRMEDLLQAKYEKKPSLSMLGGKMKVNFELFLYQINKKFYV